MLDHPGYQAFFHAMAAITKSRAPCSDIDKEMEELIVDGRRYYNASKYSRALLKFTRILKICPCNQGTKRPRCTCKNYEAVAQRGASMLHEALHTCSCTAHSVFGTCDSELHLKALDYRAATFQIIKELDRAERDAEWMLELFPYRAEGYLRLGKNARLRRNAWYARCIYASGVEACEQDSPETDPAKLTQLKQLLAPLQKRFKRRDPMTLPLEIVHEVLRGIDIYDLTNCVSVSKLWKSTLESTASHHLWRELIFDHVPPHPPTQTAIRALVRRSGGTMRKIVIKSPVRLELSQPRLTALLRHAERLEHLEIGPVLNLWYWFPRGPRLWKRLSRLVIDASREPGSSIWGMKVPAGQSCFTPKELIAHVAGTLEYLDLHGVPGAWYERAENIPEFERLRFLRVTNSTGMHSLPVFDLAHKTPQLEQLCINNLHIKGDVQANAVVDPNDNQTPAWRPVWHKLWTKLKVFIYTMPKCHQGANQLPATLLAVTMINSMHLGRNYEYLDLDVAARNTNDPNSLQFVFSDADDLHFYGLTEPDGSPILRRRQFQNLRALHLKHWIHMPAKMHSIFAASLDTLQSFDIVLPPEDLESSTGVGTTRALLEYDWLRGLSSIRCIGFSGLSFCAFAPMRSGLPLPDFVASFPNIKTLCFTNVDCNDDAAFCIVIEEILKEKPASLCTIIHNCIQGVMMDSLRSIGPSYGVQILYGTRERNWPIRVDQ